MNTQLFTLIAITNYRVSQWGVKANDNRRHLENCMAARVAFNKCTLEIIVSTAPLVTTHCCENSIAPPNTLHEQGDMLSRYRATHTYTLILLRYEICLDYIADNNVTSFVDFINYLIVIRILGTTRHNKRPR